MTFDAPTAAIYARQSKGSKKSVKEQEDDARQACDDHGWHIYDVYKDLVGASRYSGRPRKDWDRLLADLKAGEIRILVLWESSRGDRRARWWMDLLETCFEQQIFVHIVDDERTYNLDVATDWRVLASSGVESEYESRRLSARIKRDTKANAKKGRPHGGILYGFQRVYGLEDGKRVLLSQERHPEQAPVVREVISRLAAGEAVIAIGTDLDKRRIQPARGEKWNRATIRKMALNQAYIGRRRHLGQWIPAEEWFPPIADPEEFWQAEKRMQLRTKKATGLKSGQFTRPGTVKHLLTWVAKCGVCQQPMGICKRPGPRPYMAYRCNVNGCTSIRETWADSYVTGRVCALLDNPAFWEEFAQGDGEEARQARIEAAEATAQLDDYRRKAIARKITADSFAVIEEGLKRAIEDATRRAETASAPPALMAAYRKRDLGGMRKLFESWPLPVRRDIITSLYQTVMIMPSGTGRKVPDRERIIMQRVTPGEKQPGGEA